MGRFNDSTKIREVLSNAEAVALVEEYAPGITKHPMVGFVKMFTLKQAFSYRNAVKDSLKLTDEEIDRFVERLMQIE
ncbi:MAG: hypothetical protein LBT30_08305 [Clostridiales bacterium]|jgi:hypothetical protein|nr:hypothetical protein [Clostridiales bacterium]